MQPGDSHGRLRASHADREQVIEALKIAFVQGRLTGDELDTRVGQALAARTYADLAALTADLPVGLPGLPGLAGGLPAGLTGDIAAGLTGDIAAGRAGDLPVVFIDDVPVVLTDGLPAASARTRPTPRSGRQPMSTAAKGALSVTAAVAVLLVLTVVTGGVGFWLGAAFYVMALLVAGAQVLYSRQQRRARGQLPPGPMSGGPVLEADQPGTTSQDPGSRPDQTRTDLRTRRPTRRPVVPLATGSFG